MADKYIQNMLAFSDQLQGEKEYWLAELSGITEFTGFPADFHPRADAVVTAELAKADFNFPEPLSMRLITISNQSAIRVFLLLLCGINYLLYRYTGNEDLIMGMPVMRQKNGAPSPVNNLISLHSRLSGHTPFKELLLEIKQTVNDAVKHQNYPFSKLAELLNWQNMNSKGEDGTFASILPVIATLENLHDAIAIDDIIAAPAIVFQFKMSERIISCSLKYTPDYAPSTVVRIWDHLLKFLDTVAQNPSISLAEIDIPDAAEKNQVLYDFNRTGQKYPIEKTIHQLFEEQVERTPDNIALICANARGEESRLTYRGLNNQANKLAGELRRKGVIPDSIAGIMVERAPEMLIGILGILKAGGAYLPIDPEYPEERVKYMLADSGARLLLTKKTLAEKFDFTGNKIYLDEESYTEASYSDDTANLEHINKAGDLAYVIYTSGSTGVPKGVMIEHRAVNNLINGVIGRIEFQPRKTILAITTVSFDIFVLETLLPLTVGMKIVMADEKLQKDPKALNELIIHYRIDMIQATPSRMQLLMREENSAASFRNLKEIMIGGEQLPQALLESLEDRRPQTDSGYKVFNMYGPTETTVWSAIKELTGSKNVYIGGPIANTQIYILDKYRNIQPVGVPGELYIAGDGLARGYINKPDLTAERFVENPFVEVGASVDASQGTCLQRMYKTGDLARYLEDGSIEFLGRMDYQVKIRGYRIELGEIESALLKHEAVKEAVVVDSEDTEGVTGIAGAKYLCAYFVVGDMLAYPPQDLRAHLLKTLPEYMIPSFFVQLEKLPLTPNGKIDKKALVAPKGMNITGVEYAPPTNEIETQLVMLWQEVLNLDKIGIDDNFFDLGGHSFKATIIISRLYQMFNVEFPLQEIFRTPTIRKLAQYIEIEKAKQEQLKKLEAILDELEETPENS